jgi:hypothetical protein
MDLTYDRTHPVTWTFGTDQVERIWAETRQVFGNKLWKESMLDAVFPGGWQDELVRRSGQSLHDVFTDAVGHLPEGCDPSLVFLGFRRAFARYGITAEFAAHPLHGDVLARAERLGSARSGPAGAVTWQLSATDRYELLDEIGATGPDDELIAETLAMFLSERQVDELERRHGGELHELVYGAVTDLDPGAPPEAVLAAILEKIVQYGIQVEFTGDADPDDEEDED